MAGTASAHIDGIECNGGGNHEILRNMILMSNSHVSAVMLADQFGQLRDILVDGNYLKGGGYTCYHDGSFSSAVTTNVRYTNNTVVAGNYGVFFDRPSGQCGWSGNKNAAGQPV
jgi:hypothetical protein